MIYYNIQPAYSLFQFVHASKKCFSLNGAVLRFCSELLVNLSSVIVSEQSVVANRQSCPIRAEHLRLGRFWSPAEYASLRSGRELDWEKHL